MVLGRRLVPTDAVATAGVGDELVLLHVETGVYYGLDPIGTQIWQMLAEGAAEEDIVASLLDNYDVELEILRADVAQLIDQLEVKGMLRPVV